MDQQSARALWQSLPEEISARVEDAVMDLSASFAAAALIEAPQARGTYDKFHVVSQLKPWAHYRGGGNYWQAVSDLL
jgi:transposase